MTDCEKTRTKCEEDAKNFCNEIYTKVQSECNLNDFEMLIFKMYFALGLGTIIIQRDIKNETNFFEKVRTSVSERLEKEMIYKPQNAD